MRGRTLFSVTLGLSDGIITALMIASARIASNTPVSLYEALRISFGSSLVGAFSYFVAEYSRLRGEIVRISRQLTMVSPWKLIHTRIGHSILIESLEGTTLSGFSGFAGALIPLASDVYLHQLGEVPFVISIAALSILGIGLARSISGHYATWALGMALLGVLMSYVGLILHIAG
ncbi:hypothetical protein [Thermoplasma volcanium]|uniref:hypothetical protein n=1 Tax=Thermoplasma volcanium TaxID=50339 RepID=UPI001F526BA4|nr:hypothetical protein [Thermoplasma volcanium]